MADVQHKNLTGTDLHEPKGVAAVVSADRVYKSDGGGSGAWGLMNGDELDSTGAANGDVLIADGSGGTDWTAAGGATYGELQIAANTTSQALSALDIDVDTNYVKVQKDGGGTQWTDGETSGVTLDATNAYMTIVTAGLYEVSFWASFENDTNSAITAFKYSVDDTTSNLSTRRLTRKTGTGGDIGSVAASGFVNLVVGAKLSLWVASSSACAVTMVDSGVTVTLLAAA